MREQNQHETAEEFRAHHKTEHRRAKRTTKMKMSGKGMKRFASPTGRQTNSKKPTSTN